MNMTGFGQARCTRTAECDVGKDRWLDALRGWERYLTLAAVDEAIRLLESDQFEKLTDQHVHCIAEYGAITIDDESFFNKAFSTGKEVAACLACARMSDRAWCSKIWPACGRPYWGGHCHSQCPGVDALRRAPQRGVTRRGTGRHRPAGGGARLKGTRSSRPRVGRHARRSRSCTDLEGGAGRVHAPLRRAAEPHRHLTAHDGHALCAVGVEVKLADVDDSDRVRSAVAVEADALNLAVEIAVVLEHGSSVPKLAAAANRSTAGPCGLPHGTAAVRVAGVHHSTS